MIVRAIYTSTPAARLERDTLDAYIAPIRTEALSFNPTRNLTGALAYSEECFVQGLEGEDADVEALLTKIAKDRRHGNFQIISKRAVVDRAFPDWAMAFAPAPGFSAKGMSANALVRYLIDAAQNCRQVRAIPGFPVA